MWGDHARLDVFGRFARRNTAAATGVTLPGVTTVGVSLIGGSVRRCRTPVDHIYHCLAAAPGSLEGGDMSAVVRDRRRSQRPWTRRAAGLAVAAWLGLAACSPAPEAVPVAPKLPAVTVVA